MTGLDSVIPAGGDGWAFGGSGRAGPFDDGDRELPARLNMESRLKAPIHALVIVPYKVTAGLRQQIEIGAVDNVPPQVQHDETRKRINRVSILCEKVFSAPVRISDFHGVIPHIRLIHLCVAVLSNILG